VKKTRTQTHTCVIQTGYVGIVTVFAGQLAMFLIINWHVSFISITLTQRIAFWCSFLEHGQH